jgi:hypothetical protein
VLPSAVRRHRQEAVILKNATPAPDPQVNFVLVYNQKHQKCEGWGTADGTPVAHGTLAGCSRDCICHQSRNLTFLELKR